MAMEASKLREWLEKQEPEGRGRNTRLSEQTGLSRPYISKVLAGKTRDVKASTLQDVARYMDRDPDDLIGEIFAGSAPNPRRRKASDVVVPMDAKIKRDWDRLFAGRPARAREVIANITRQEKAGLTDLVSEIVTLILEHGPNDAALEVANRLHRWKPTKRRTRSQQRTQS